MSLSSLLTQDRRSQIGLLITLTLVVLTEQANAAGFRLPNQNAFATARGNAQVASAQGASSVYYNPAALAQPTADNIGSEAEIGLYAIKFSVDLDHSLGSSYSNTDKFQFVPQMFYSHSGERFGWGLGVYAPFGLGNEWGNGTAFSTVTTEAELTYITTSPVIAYRLGDGLSIGAGLTVNMMSADLQQALGVVPGDLFRFKGSSTEIGYLLSALWAPSDHHSLGVFYRSSADHDLSGHTLVSFIPGRQKSSAEVAIPDHLILGYSYRPSEAWNFEFDLEWGNWSRLEQVNVRDTALGDLPLEFNWQDGFIYQFGVTRYFEDFSLSAGYDYNESVQPDGNYNPAVADADRHWFNFGVASNTNKIRWSAVYQYGYSNRAVSGSAMTLAGETADGEYRARLHSFMLSLGYRF